MRFDPLRSPAELRCFVDMYALSASLIEWREAVVSRDLITSNLDFCEA
jgi:hypothetical protein